MKRCEEKIRYRTAAAARWSLWGIWLDRYLRGRWHRRERRAYACPHCDGWHLTSQPKRRPKARHGRGQPGRHDQRDPRRT